VFKVLSSVLFKTFDQSSFAGGVKMFKKKKGDDARKKRKWEQEADEDYDVNAPLPEKREASPEPEWSEGLYDEEVSACRYRVDAVSVSTRYRSPSPTRHDAQVARRNFEEKQRERDAMASAAADRDAATSTASNPRVSLSDATIMMPTAALPRE
jgi:hypothetical protein